MAKDASPHHEGGLCVSILLSSGAKRQEYAFDKSWAGDAAQGSRGTSGTTDPCSRGPYVVNTLATALAA